jgi:hypothetical protein
MERKNNIPRLRIKALHHGSFVRIDRRDQPWECSGCCHRKQFVIGREQRLVHGAALHVRTQCGQAAMHGPAAIAVGNETDVARDFILLQRRPDA